MARRFIRGRRPKRAVAWVPGVSNFDALGARTGRLLGLANLGGTHWGAAIQLTTTADLTLHGGEDCVVQRIRGRLSCVTGRINAGAGLAAAAFQLRVVIATTAVVAGGGVTPFDYTSSAGLGIDEIMWWDDAWPTATLITTPELNTGLHNPPLFIDCKAKRRVDENRQIVLWFQTQLPVGTTGADFVLLGGLRLLMARPK